MDGELIERTEEISKEDVYDAIFSISKRALEVANWPVVSFVSKEVFDSFNEGQDSSDLFWKHVLDPKNFLNSNERTTYDVDSDVLFVLHSFKDLKGQDTIFKAITTSPKIFVRDPEIMINYRHHGQPCENRSKGFYPTLKDFWSDFYDRLSQKEQDMYPIPDRNWRKSFLTKSS